jgi:predicted RNA-binding protein with RPS1 domain
VHRKGEEVQANFARELVETVSIDDRVAVEVRDKYGNIKMTPDSRDMTESPESKHDESKENESTNKNTDSTEWFFKDYTAKNAVSVCEEFLNLMKKFVNDLKIQFQ